VTDGLAVVDKAAGWTSHDVVARCRRLVGQRRVGHAGTLDPSATGVLLVGLGRVTRLLRFLSALPKTYAGEVVLGPETDTLDDEGEVTSMHDMAGVTVEDVRAAATALVGDIDQVPPMVSAVKVGGRRLYELARKGEEVERSLRRVTVGRFEVEPGPTPGVVRIEVDCSSGTYVRSLAADLGRALGGGAHLRHLRRLAVGSFTVAEARSLEALEVRSPAEAMRDYSRVTVPDPVARDVGHGRPLPRSAAGLDGPGPWALLDGSGGLLAVYEGADGGLAAPAVVLAAR
jgi:tRNA pseudouridine55 synthase